MSPRKFIRSTEGRALPALGEVAVHWPRQDFTNIFSSENFDFTEEPQDGEYPELIEHDAEATAKALLEALNGIMAEVAGCQREEKYERARAAIAKATASN